MDYEDGPLAALAILPDALVTAALIVAVVFAVNRRAQLGERASSLAATGFGILAIFGLFNTLWHFSIQLLVDRFGSGGVITYITVSGFISRAVYLVGLGLLIAAVFVRRPGQPPSS